MALTPKFPGVAGIKPVLDETPKEEAPKAPEAQQEETTPTETPDKNVSPLEEGFVYYSCHPIAQMLIGKYAFEASKLKLTEAEAEGFERLLAGMDYQTRALIRKIDPDAALALLQSLKPVASKTNDSSSGLPNSPPEAKPEGTLE